jgi:hypothetical protein
MKRMTTSLVALLYILCLAALLAVTALAAPEAEKKGKLFIKANIEGATIRVMDMNANFSQGMPLPAGVHIIQISKEGFETQTKKVKVDEGKDTVLHISMDKSGTAGPAATGAPQQQTPPKVATGLAAGPGVEQTPMGHDRQGKERLYVKTMPADALVRIINILETYRPGIEIGQGHYVIKVKKEGFETEVKEINMVRGNDMTVTIILKPIGPVKPETPAAQPTKPPDSTAPAAPGAAPVATTTPGATPPADITAIPADPEAVIAVGKPSGDGKTRVTIRTEPADAKVRILNFNPKYLPRMEIKPNKYEIEVIRKVYETKMVKIEIRAREDNVFDVALVSLTATPNAPLATGPPAQPGAGFDAQGGPRDVVPPAPPANGADDGAGRLFVRTDVADAPIRVLNSDKQFIQGLRLPEGLYIVEVRKKGYETRILKVVIYPGIASTIEANLVKASTRAAKPTPEPRFEQPPAPTSPEAEGTELPTAPAPETKSPAQPPEPAAPTKRTARVFVQTTPSDATVRVLGLNAPFEQGLELEKGGYTLEISKEGYQTAKQELVIEAGRDAHLDIALTLLPPPPKPAEKAPEKIAERVEPVEEKTPAPVPAPAPVVEPVGSAKGKLFVKTDAADASVKILGVKPKFEQGLELDPGKYKIEVAKPGQPAKTMTAEIVAGKETRLEVKLGETSPVKLDDQTKADKTTALLEQAADA